MVNIVKQICEKSIMHLIFLLFYTTTSHSHSHASKMHIKLCKKVFNSIVKISHMKWPPLYTSTHSSKAKLQLRRVLKIIYEKKPY